MKKVILTVFTLLTMTCIVMAQAPDKKVIIADETEIISSGENKFRIITSNEVISGKLEAKFKETTMTAHNHYRKTVKYKGKEEEYWEHSYYFNNEDYDKVMAYVKGGLK